MSLLLERTRASVLDSARAWADRHPEKLLYSFLDVSGQEVMRHSYGSFMDRVDVIAGHLCRRSRLTPGERVLLVYPPGLEMICALFASARAGLIPVPTAPPAISGSSAALYRLAHIAADCGVVGLLTTRESSGRLQPQSGRNGEALGHLAPALARVDWIITDDLEQTAGPVPDRPGSDVFFLQYTSGSTSSPKGVVVSHENVLHNSRLVVDHETPTAVSWLPQHHDMGLLGYYIYVVLSGGTTYGFSPTTFIQRPSLWLETITRYQATGTSAPNFAFEYCLRPGRLSAASMAALDLSSLRVLMAAAEPIRPETYRRFFQKFEPYGLKPKSFFVAYGLAENTLAVSSYGRKTLALDKRKLARGLVKTIDTVTDITNATYLMSCGQPLPGNTVRIVEPDPRVPLPDGVVGEVWVNGPSKCLGYWNNPGLTADVFRVRLHDSSDDAEYLRTGDVGFLHEGELFVCGRLKDLIIVRGQNIYPHDIETIVEQASPAVRTGGVAAFEIETADESGVAVVAELTTPKAKPDASAIANAVRNYLSVDMAVITFVAPKEVPKTSSGKVMRYKAKQMWAAGEFTVLGQYVREKVAVDGASEAGPASPFDALKARYGLTGTEERSLLEVGVDSVDLVLFAHELKELLESRGATLVAQLVDFHLLQQVTVADLFRVRDQMERAPAEAAEQLRHLLKILRDRHLEEERAQMRRDRTLAFTPALGAATACAVPQKSVLLTGGTGFLGPFLIKSLLDQTTATIHVLTRSNSPDEGRERLRDALFKAVAPSPPLLAEFDRRVVAVCGDLEKPNLRLSSEEWSRLADEIDTIYHNAAIVNYLFNYGTMRSANVGGTNEVLRLAFERCLKPVNYVSTTFIYGWATKDVLYETDNNDEMELLDFGYSQSKWVAEQVVLDAARKGLPTRIFRPALITPSVAGGGANFDITIRLLAFIIKHGISVNTLNQVSFVPADVTANNIVAISNLPETLNQTFHVTRDDYANMMDVTDIITARTGRQFELFALPDFVPEVIRRCTKEDLLFPLLDFLIGSIDNISSMEYKRYDSASYRQARSASAFGVPDPSLDATVGGMLTFMSRTGVI